MKLIYHFGVPTIGPVRRIVRACVDLYQGKGVLYITSTVVVAIGGGRRGRPKLSLLKPRGASLQYVPYKKSGLLGTKCMGESW
jgi:hypothetical protein